MRVVVPFDATRPKSRLESVLDAAERDAFARAMLEDVCSTVETAGGEPMVLSTAPLSDVDAPVVVDQQPLTDAVNDIIDPAFAADASVAHADSDGEHEAVSEMAVVMADLPLATADTLARLFAANGEVVLVPGRGGGTNAFVTRTPEFRVDYHEGSIRDHRETAAACADSVTEVDSFRLSTDVDEPSDLGEVLLHGEGAARQWLVDAGFSLAIDDGRVTVTR